MYNSFSGKSVVVLLDDEAAVGSKAAQRLSGKGFVTSQPADLCELFDALTDFTGYRRPEVLMLEVNSLADCYEDLQSSLRRSVSANGVSVVGLSQKASKGDPGRYIARNLDELEQMVSRESSSAA